MGEKDEMATAEQNLIDTRRAFDSVAATYDGPTGNNALIQRMRQKLWDTVEAAVRPGARLLDLGCGTGLDATHFAARGLRVVATDWSPAMIERTRARADALDLRDLVTVELVGSHEIDRLDAEPFDLVYSDLGPLNCVPDLPAVASACARLLRPGGIVVASAIGRRCPWETLYYAMRGDLNRARLRSATGAVPVGLNGHTVWTHYLAPREFCRAFADSFDLVKYRAMCLFLPPPYLIHVFERLRPLFEPLGWLDDHLGALPFLRDAGDHFLIVLRRRE